MRFHVITFSLRTVTQKRILFCFWINLQIDNGRPLGVSAKIAEKLRKRNERFSPLHISRQSRNRYKTWNSSLIFDSILFPCERRLFSVSAKSEVFIAVNGIAYNSNKLYSILRCTWDKCVLCLSLRATIPPCLDKNEGKICCTHFRHRINIDSPIESPMLQVASKVIAHHTNCGIISSCNL